MHNNPGYVVPAEKITAMRTQHNAPTAAEIKKKTAQSMLEALVDLEKTMQLSTKSKHCSSKISLIALVLFPGHEDNMHVALTLGKFHNYLA